jgi:hypothetical protein
VQHLQGKLWYISRWHHSGSILFCFVSISIIDGAPCRFIMKAPFVTNSQHFKRFVNVTDDARRHMNTVTKDFYGPGRATCYVIPYMILQERVEENNDVKMVFINSTFSHFISGKSTWQHLPKKFNVSKEDVITFGTNILHTLKANHPHFIVDGLFRVVLTYSFPRDWF